MVLNLYCLGAALVLGCAAGIVASHRMRNGGSAAAAVTRALVLGGSGSLLAGIGGIGIAGADFFAVIHVFYLVVVVAVPLAALIMLLRAAPVPRLLAVVLSGCLFLAPLGTYMSRVEPFWLRVDRVELEAANVGSAFRIGVLSDLQTTSIGAYENAAIDALLAEEPDLILIPGDFWQLPGSEFTERSPEFAAAMQRLAQGADHVFVVNGNTDTVMGLEEITVGTGVEVLDNRVVEVEVRGTTLRVGGITLFGDGEAGAQRTAERLMAQAGPDMRILLAHQPDEVYRLVGSPIDLVVSGHTHGGQIAVPFLGPPLTLSAVPRSIGAGGLGVLEGTPIYVSTGVGRERGNAPQMRFGVRPSIGIITVVPVDP